MSSASLIHIAGKLFNSPLFIHPSKAEAILWALQDKLDLSFEVPKPESPEASRFMGSRRRESRDNALTRSTNGVALVTIEGSLVNRGAWIGAYSGVTSYEGVAAQIRDAANDHEVHSILLDIDSPGGEATGMFNLASLIREVRQSKRVVAFVDDMAASAAYGIASAAHEIVVSPTSIVGSIGVVMLHLDRSGELAAKGVKPTLIHAGAHKVDGHPFGPLSKEVAADLQRSVMTFYDQFLATVEAGRGSRTSVAKAKETEARTYIGADAIQAGLADRVATLDQVLAELSQAPRSDGRANSGARHMAENQNPAGIPQAEHDRLVAAARAEGRAEGVQAGEAAAVARLDAIMSLEETKGREAQAMALFKAGLGADAAKGVLAAGPKGSTLASRIEQHESVGAPEGDQAKTSAEAAKAGWGKAVAAANARFN